MEKRINQLKNKIAKTVTEKAILDEALYKVKDFIQDELHKAMFLEIANIEFYIEKLNDELNYYTDLDSTIPSEKTVDMLQRRLKKEKMFIEISDDGLLTLNKDTNTNSTILFNNPIDKIIWNVMSQEVVSKTNNADLVIDKELLSEVKLCYNLK
jgi:hypothetical protein